MEQKHVVCDRMPNLSAKYPWLVAQKLEEDDQIFYTMHAPELSLYRCRIPELVGRRIRGCFHGWVILSNHPHNVLWSLWNPVTSKTIRLPPLVLKDGDYTSIKQCCLSSPPSDPTSVLMLTRTKTATIVFCRLKKGKRLGWKEMTYSKQLRSITAHNGFLHCLTCCNGKVYALITGTRTLIQVDIVVHEDKGEVVIRLLAFGKKLPLSSYYGCSSMWSFLKGCCTDLFFIIIGFDKVPKETLNVVYLFKLNWTSMIWEEMEGLKESIFLVNLAHGCSVFYRHAIASELGGYIHILGGDTGKVIYSYDVKDRTISLSSLCCLVQSTHVSLWECRLQGDDGEIKCGTPEDDKEEEDIMVIKRSVMDDTRNEENLGPCLVDIPFDVLKMIMGLCVGVEYLNFRASCKRCQLAAPMIRWSNETSQRRLQTYSLISPWLVVLDTHRGILTFTDPMFGDKYFMTTPQELIGDLRVYCSRYGWLLLFKCTVPGELFFFNPFTNDIREIPDMPYYFESVCFSAPPTSPDCIVVGLSASLQAHVYVYFVNREPSLRMFLLDFGCTAPPHSFLSSTFYGQDIYALNHGGALDVFREVAKGSPFWDRVVAEAPSGKSGAQYFLANCDDHHLTLVMVDEIGEFVEVLKLNDSTKKWEKIDSLGRHVIYICGTRCLCMEAKTPEMANNIYFARLHSKSGKILFYSLETCRFQTINGNEQCLGDFFGTKYHVYPHAWIEPSWST